MSQPPSKLSRRTLFGAVGTVSALAATGSLIPAVAPSQTAALAPKTMPEKGGGYSLSDHVKQYYKTTLV